MKQEIIDKIALLIKEDRIEELMGEMRDLQSEYHRLSDEEKQAQLEAFQASEEAENEEVEFNPTSNPLDARFNELLTTFKEKKDAFYKKKDEERQQTIDAKKTLIDNLSKLSEESDNIGFLFGKFKEILAAWKETGAVAGGEGRALQSDFNYQVDLFYHNVNICKDLRDMDFNRNLEAKKEIIEKVEGIVEIENINELESQMKKCQHEWYDVGPVPFELKDEINGKFKELADKIYSRIQAHYDERRGEFQANLKLKIALCEQLNELAVAENTNHKDWDEKTEQIIKIQEEWKAIGYSTENETIWQVFRNICDKFFDAKRGFYDKLSAEREGHAKKKADLCQKAEAVKESTDWKKTTEYLIGLQKEWKAVGPAARKDENRLWNQFRTACDTFFNAKKSFYEGLDEAYGDNLKAKDELVIKLESYALSGNDSDDFAALKEFSSQWGKIGFVPIKEKNRVTEAFHKALDAKYDALKVDRNQRAEMKYQNKLDGMLQSDQSGDLLKKERYHLQEKIQKIQGDIAQYENNLGFFGNSNKANPLIKTVEEKLKKLRGEVGELKKKLHLIPR